MTDDIRNRLSAGPFVPFPIYTADGREYAVSTTDQAHVWPNRLRASVYTGEGREFVLPSSLIRGLDVAADSPANP